MYSYGTRYPATADLRRNIVLERPGVIAEKRRMWLDYNWQT